MMCKAVVNGKIITPAEIIDKGVVIVEGDEIIACGPAQKVAVPENSEIIEAGGNYIAPGFIDIHCHGGGGHYFHDEPDKAAKAHLKYGTTSVLATTFLMDKESMLKGIERIIEADNPCIIGIHMEAPYLNKKYGARKELYRLPDPDEYNAFLALSGNHIRLWTFAPELEGTDEFIEAVSQKGIILSVGHSEADACRIFDIIPKGLKLGCHCMCATGVTPPSAGGVREVGVDEAVMASDDLYAEVIPDSIGIHVRPLMLKLIYKAKGADRIIIITDAIKDAGRNDMAYTEINSRDLEGFYDRSRIPMLRGMGSINAEGKDKLEVAEDVNFNELGRLAGSRLTMNCSVRNMIKHTGISMVEAFKMASLNPARLLGVDNEIGSLEKGKKANIIIVTDKIEVKGVIFRGSLLS